MRAAVDRLWRGFHSSEILDLTKRKPVSKWLTFPVGITYCQDQSPRNKNLKLPPIKLTFNNPAIMTVVLLGLLVFNVRFSAWQLKFQTDWPRPSWQSICFETQYTTSLNQNRVHTIRSVKQSQRTHSSFQWHSNLPTLTTRLFWRQNFHEYAEKIDPAKCSQK